MEDRTSDLLNLRCSQEARGEPGGMGVWMDRVQVGLAPSRDPVGSVPKPTPRLSPDFNAEVSSQGVSLLGLPHLCLCLKVVGLSPRRANIEVPL